MALTMPTYRVCLDWLENSGLFICWQGKVDQGWTIFPCQYAMLKVLYDSIGNSKFLICWHGWWFIISFVGIDNANVPWQRTMPKELSSLVREFQILYLLKHWARSTIKLHINFNFLLPMAVYAFLSCIIYTPWGHLKIKGFINWVFGVKNRDAVILEP